MQSYFYQRCASCKTINLFDQTRINDVSKLACGKCGAYFAISDLNYGYHQPILRFVWLHWNGRFSLFFSYWVVSFLTNALVTALTILLVGYSNLSTSFNPFIFLVLYSMFLCSVIFISMWHIVGTWRSADLFFIKTASKNKLWGIAAKFFLIASLVQLISSMSQAPVILSEYTKMALFNDPSIPNYKISVSRDRSVAFIEGGFKYGMSRELIDLLKQTPEIKVLHLESLGGRISIGEEINKIVRDFGLNTMVTSYCMSSCTVAFLGGRERFLEAGARLGFHASAQFGKVSNASRNFDYKLYRKLTVDFGTSELFIREIVSTPHESMWFPENQTLLKEHIITSLR
jgi:hypothetical protein